MSLLGKLGKVADKIQKKATELVDESTRAAQHKINSVRDHPELRDITVESKALPGNVQSFVRLLTAATTKLVNFSRDYCGAPDATCTALIDSAAKLHGASVQSSQHLVAFTTAMEEILKGEQAVESAEKAVANAEKSPKPGQDIAALKSAAEASKNALVEIKKKYVKEALTGFVTAQTDLFNAMIALTQEQIAAAQALPAAYPGPAIPYEALYDEPRPFLGNSAAKPPPSQEKRKPHEELALLPRPVDGDTRAKYAKIWNEEIADTLEAHRLAMREADRWFALRLTLARHLEKWVDSSPTNAPFKTALSCVPIFENQFIERHLPEYKKNYEALYPGLEKQRAPVPAKDVAPETPNPNIPKERAAAAKEALIGSLRATLTFGERGKAEVAMFYSSTMGNLP